MGQVDAIPDPTEASIEYHNLSRYKNFQDQGLVIPHLTTRFRAVVQRVCKSCSWICCMVIFAGGTSKRPSRPLLNIEACLTPAPEKLKLQLELVNLRDSLPDESNLVSYLHGDSAQFVFLIELAPPVRLFSIFETRLELTLLVQLSSRRSR
ncbi:hypothetical protein BDR07DRAFT_1378580 [Suillus spraguei]|nr:hypothetical protein BDR07DRAFT_1378580 [Suillus spraguei]